MKKYILVLSILATSTAIASNEAYYAGDGYDDAGPATEAGDFHYDDCPQLKKQLKKLEDKMGRSRKTKLGTTFADAVGQLMKEKAAGEENVFKKTLFGLLGETAKGLNRNASEKFGADIDQYEQLNEIYEDSCKR